MSAPTPPPAQPPVQPPVQPVAPGRHPGKVGVGRHVLSVVVAVVAVGIALVALDFATTHGLLYAVQTFNDRLPPLRAVLALGFGGLLLLVAASCGRVSALGPLVAGVVGGVLPGLLFLFAPISGFKVVRSLPEAYNSFGLGITGYGGLFFAALGALLLGTAISGRWR